MKKSFNITLAALFTAVLALLSQISIASPSVPVTLQILGVCLCGYVLPLKWAMSCIITYISVGALGLPVFSMFQGGIQMLLGPTGGFILGFLPLTLFCTIASNRNKLIYKILFSALGLVICHLFGTVQYSLITGNGFMISLLTASLPFFIKDIVLIFGAYFLSKLIKKQLSLRI